MQAEASTTEITVAEDAVLRLTMAVGRRFRTRHEDDPVDPSQAAALYALKCHGAMRLGDLAEVMRLDASTVSRHVQQLGDRGLIERVPDPVDGRARIIDLSPAGLDALRITFDQRRAVLAASLEGWSPADRDRLRDDLVRLIHDLGDL